MGDAKKDTVKKPTPDSRRFFRLWKKEESQARQPLITTKDLCYQSWFLLRKEWKLFGGIGLLYVVGYRVLVEGLGRLDLSLFTSTLHGNDSIANRTTQIAGLTTAAFDAASTSSDPQAGVYATVMSILFFLIIVWALRQVLAGRNVRIRDALYNGPTAFIPVLAILGIICLQLLPLSVGIFVYTAATVSGILTTWLQNAAIFVLASALAILSCYWIAVSIMGLMAASLPGMYPMAALHGAKKLVEFRRFKIVMRIVVFALLLALMWLIVVVVTVSNRLTLVFLTEVIDILRGLSLLLGTVYLYKLYRSLVDEKTD